MPHSANPTVTLLRPPAELSGVDTAICQRTLVERMQAAIFVEQDQRVIFVNPRLIELFGYSRAELLSGIEFTELVAPEDQRTVREQRRRRAAGVPGHAYDLTCVRRDGSQFIGRLHGVSVELNGRLAQLVTLLDVSELKRATHAAERRSNLLAQTEELALIGSSEYDVPTGVVTQSAGMFRVFGEAPGAPEVDGEWLMRRVPAREQAAVRAALRGLAPGDACEFEHRIVHADGNERTLLHRAMAEADGHGRTARVVGIVQDITAQRAAEQQLTLLASIDELTSLPNRAALLEALDSGLRQARAEAHELALLVLQIDQLKLVSDSLGYASGDRLLADVGQRLRGAVQASDAVAHLGSGEYAVLLAPRGGFGEAQALAAARALLDAFTAPFFAEATELPVTCTIGLSSFPRDGGSADQLLHQARAARQRAHEQPDDRVCIYTPEAHARAALRLSLEAALRRALERGQFQLHYQPQLDLTSGAVVGCEALLRWYDPLRGMVSPLDFIPLAEETGLIVPIGEWVLRTACLQNLAWQQAGLPPVRVAVNLSVRQLQQPDIARRIHKILLETGLQPRYLGLEITESMLLGESAHVARVLGEMRALGIEISLDDFGTGYSNLSYLRTLPIDVVKVDRSLVHDVTAPASDVSMTRAVINMAHSLQLKVLAEGVETAGQLALLIANQCDQMQGYFFSKPIVAEAMADLLRERRRLPERLLQRKAAQRTLLLVDDEPDVVAALKRLLRRDGWRIATAASGEQALQRLAKRPVDVILCDQQLPGMSGVELLRRARALFPDAIRIVLSAGAAPQSISDAINDGAVHKCLSKPWNDERLRSHVIDAFRQKELADENHRLGRAAQLANQELAEANRRLQASLESHRERIDREETSLAVTRQLLQSIPAPMIGFDDDGMIAFANADAESLLGSGGRLSAGLLGRQADEALPAELLAVWQGSDGLFHRIQMDGRPFQAVCRPTGDNPQASGRLLMIAPSDQR